MLCTGYSEHVTAENYQHLGLAGFVAKPFSAETLAREVARIMRETKKIDQ
jgi:DNA-binding NtrC family response regulator